MATYRELHGKAVKTVTTNPTDEAAEGQIWFNSTDNTFKSIVSLEATSSASPLSTATGPAVGSQPHHGPVKATVLAPLHTVVVIVKGYKHEPSSVFAFGS